MGGVNTIAEWGISTDFGRCGLEDIATVLSYGHHERMYDGWDGIPTASVVRVSERLQNPGSCDEQLTLIDNRNIP